MTAVIDHLWQSTWFAAAAALLAFALRNHAARVRYWLWLAASLKFLAPFGVLAWIGSRMQWRSATEAPHPAVTMILDHIGRPLSPSAAGLAGPANHSWMPALWIGAWSLGSACVLLSWLRRWMRMRLSIRAATPLPLEFPIRALSSPAPVEPGVFGIFRPVLLLPHGIADRLSPAQLRSVLLHELCHVHRRDNLWATIHTLVQAVFWFHPLVWIIGARLIEERERACDEAVLSWGSEPRVYAQSLLDVCRLYLESPAACVAGVTGSDLNKRIQGIMSHRRLRPLDGSRRLMLWLAAAGAIAGPVMLGVLNAPRILAQATYDGPGFEVASIKPSDPGARGSGLPPAVGGRFRAVNVTTRELIGYAYHRHARITGGPNWLDTARYDVAAKAESNVPEEKIRPMVLRLLQDRFALKFHHEEKQMQAYAMTVAKNGPKFTVSDECAPDPEHKSPCGGFRVYRRSYVSGQQVSSADLAEVLEALLDMPVIDRTGIKGVFKVTLQWTPDERMPVGNDAGVAPVNSDAPSLFGAMQDQLGLKLEHQKMAVDVVVIDSAQRPAAN
jgi:uncharacterized protein (TIGR03435 family)